MCGRFTLTVDTAQLQEAFPGVEIPDGIAPRYNIAPTQPVAVIPNEEHKKLDFYVWGLIPSWAKDPEIGSRMINARAETLADKPAFRTAFHRRRCLIPASGFYEWRQEPGSRAKTPIYVQLESGEPFALAGLWEIWNSSDGSLIKSCTIITTEPNPLLERIHNRMPVIVRPKDYNRWLDPKELKTQDLHDILTPYPAIEMIAHPVSRMVNSPDNDQPECVAPLAE